ncbi:MAG: thiamine pyrophosphate-dependent enzyme [Bacteroidota bacterium]|jgi:pyruvate/2-oxoglutarate/acetoin dehydrogenase E1 component/TPP-dependent pyruvate/acetoin dehydrogenase alpha subunit
MTKKNTTFTSDYKSEVLSDYYLANLSRQLSLLGRREVLTGKAKFGIFGDGKEIPQLAMAKVFQKGDWRSGYYRDQTFMLAAGLMEPEEFFAQLYGDTNPNSSPGTGGRLMNNHFATRSLVENGNWKNLMEQKNSSADISPTAGQMPRLLGLALASKLYKANKELYTFSNFSNLGNEVAFGTIGDSSTSEGHFWETINAAGVMQVPMAISVWDDGWGISVPNKYQTTKQNISEVLSGFENSESGKGFKILKAKAWDYETLVTVYQEGIEHCRKEHNPVLFHITEVTQPQGHSTSGSHERYKSEDRLQWEYDFDGIKRMQSWILEQKIASKEELEAVESKAIKRAKDAKKSAWKAFLDPIKAERYELLHVANIASCHCSKTPHIEKIKNDLAVIGEPLRKDIISSARKILRLVCDKCSDPNHSLKSNVKVWLQKQMAENEHRYNSFLYSHTKLAAQRVAEIPAQYSDQSRFVPGREILRDNWDYIYQNNPLVVAFGEDVGKIGGVNQTYEGLQEKYGENRIFDTGIREATIIGQGLGMALRGLRPVAEIQYFDYLLYGLQVMSDDIATTLYRTNGGQKAPIIISTRGHRLEGIWHSGSPLSMVINSIRGMHVCVPRNMTQAAGFYNTLLLSDEPALVIEPLNAYRLKERMPDNLGQFRVPLGKPEILKAGKDISVVTYGSCVRIAQDAVEQLSAYGIDVELIDVQTLLPFDTHGVIGRSLNKTNKVLFFDEDVPGGATAFMMQKVLEEQRGYFSLDAEPKTLTAKDHRAAYGSDGDYFSNPNAEDVFEAVYNIMHELNPVRFPKIF